MNSIRIFETFKNVLAILFASSTLISCSKATDSAELSISIPSLRSTTATLTTYSLQSPSNNLQSFALNSKVTTMAGGGTTAAYAPADVSGFDCLLVNVVGPGIGSWNDNEDRVSLAKNFSYIGIFSKLISVATGGEVTVKIKKGSGRYIQLIGVRSDDGLCPSSVTQEDLLDIQKFPGLFIVAAAQKDVFKNETIRLASNYDVTQTSDIRGTESEPNPPVIDNDSPQLPIGEASQLTPGSVGATSIELTWAGASDRATVDGQLEYKVLYTTDPLNTFSSAEQIAAATIGMDWINGQTSYIFTGLLAGTTYRFLVLVKDAAGNISEYPIKEVATSAAGTTKFTVSYHKNNLAVEGTVPSDTTEYGTGSPVTVASSTGLVYSGYQFDSWNTSADGSGTKYLAGSTLTMGSSNVNLYAQWIAEPTCQQVGSSCLPSGLLAYWSFDDMLADQSINGYTLTSKATADDSTVYEMYSATIKKFGYYSVDLSSGTRYLDSGQNILSGRMSYSVGGWVYVNSHQNTNTSVSFWGQVGVFSLGFNNSGSNKDDVCVNIGGANGVDVCSAANISLSAWHHIMVTFSASGVVNLFVDGGSPVTGSGTAGVTSTNPFTIGHHAWIASGQGPDPLDGYVDELMIYDRELSSQEVQMIYQQYP